MENISYIENENSLVILLDKQKLDRKMIDSAKRFFFLQAIYCKPMIHHTFLLLVPVVSTGEQKEIDELLNNPELK